MTAVERVTRAPETPARASDAGEPAWMAALGARWRTFLGVLGALLVVAGALAPLADIDLPMHLAVGEWIVRHGTVPFEEPFAWTRAGAPYYAYSWAADWSYFQLLRSAGPLGLRLLDGLLLAASGAAALWLGRVAGWRPWTTVLLAALNVLLTVAVAPFLRPQNVLFVTVPLAWGLVMRVRQADERGASIARPVAGLLAACALTANVHLLFPITALPAAHLVADPPRRRSTVLAVAAAIVVGWLCSPYALAWPEVFGLNFAPNALFTPPTWIAEFQPGFSLVSRGNPAALVVLLLSALPWMLPASSTTARERAVFAALWLVGLVGFALAARAIVVWWMAVLPMIARVADRLPHPTTGALRRAQQGALVAGCLALMLRMGLPTLRLWREEGTVARRQLPSPAAPSVEPLAAWLDAHTRRDAGGRVLTAFHFGSYLAWRLPRYSASIDGRTIFPDSAAGPEAYRTASDGPLPLGPWTSAELAIVPLRLPVAAVLDTARGWRRVAVADSGARVPMPVGLWVRDAWWEGARAR